jgi:carboxypeptidase C (cathepsin A)
MNPRLKVIALAGYHDLATPFMNTERDLARLGARPGVRVRNYDGGHMIYLDDASRVRLRADLVQFYLMPVSE